MIDAMCHLELFGAPAAAARALEAAASRGVTDVVSAGTDPLLPEVVPPAALVRIHRAFGIHPELVRRLGEQVHALEHKLDGPAVVAVGECGLDARDGTPPMELQQQAFAAQIAIARRRGLPVIVHGVRCPALVLAAMKDAGVPWVWHAFAESLETAKHAKALGAVISVGALVLNPRARKVRESIAGLGDDVLLETDAPDVDLTALADVALAVAEVKKTTGRAVAEASAALARKVFGIAAR
ncbi:MAG TPA: TatD family hydrolase [Myxococcota bacterium]